VILATGDPTNITTTNTIKVKGARFTSSYEEVIAMETAAEWIAAKTDADETVVIGTDSQSLC